MEYLKSILHTQEVQKSKINLNFEKQVVFISRHGIKDTGSYIFIINSQKYGGATAIFVLSRSDRTKHGSVVQLSACSAISGEYIECTWKKFEYPKLQLHNIGHSKVNLDYELTIL